MVSSAQEKVILVATSNAKKLEAIRQVMGDLPGYAFMSLADLDGGTPFEEPAEDGETFADNAKIKALGYLEQAQQRGLKVDGVLAEDSGIAIEAITQHAAAQGNPEPMGVYTKDFFGDRKGRERTFHVLEQIKAAHDAGFESNSALFTCAACLVLVEADKADPTIHEVEGTVALTMAQKPVWNENDLDAKFSLDPITVPVEQKIDTPITMAEYKQLSPEEREKTGIQNHRTLAMEAVREVLAQQN